MADIRAAQPYTFDGVTFDGLVVSDGEAPRPGVLVIDDLKPAEGEPVVEKTFASAFAGTDLEKRIGGAGAPVVFAGFMTHNCVSSTVRAGIERGSAMTVAADACATRDLPLAGRIVPAWEVHEAELAGLGDAHAAIRTVAEIVG